MHVNFYVCVLLGGSYVYIFTSITFVEVGLDVFLHAEMVAGLGKKMIVILAHFLVILA